MIRKATYGDIPALMEIFRKAREIMRASGNMNQWNDSYPSEDIAASFFLPTETHVRHIRKIYNFAVLNTKTIIP